jgi:hypothetical protein
MIGCMPVHSRYCVQLNCHIETPCSAVDSVEAELTQNHDGQLAVSYMLAGNVDRLRIPVAVTPQRADGLWRHTCFEAFIAVEGVGDYYEFNFSPSGEWAAYAFQGYRDGAALDDTGLNPGIILRAASHRFELDGVIRLNRLAAIVPTAALRVGFAAVIEERGGALSYWALRHPPGKPDFHCRDSFLLKLSRSLDAADNTAYNPKT